MEEQNQKYWGGCREWNIIGKEWICKGDILLKKWYALKEDDSQ